MVQSLSDAAGVSAAAIAGGGGATMLLSENLTSFVLSRMACPISKKPLVRENDDFIAPSGLRYPNGDFRVGLEFSKTWKMGQDHNEHGYYAEAGRPDVDFEAADAELVEIYDKIKVEGDVLDVGGYYGVLVQQARLDYDRYAVVDPSVCLWSRLPQQGKFIRHYSSVKNVPRILGCAEFLPIADATFDTVHMRSCLDHFNNPMLALKEAFRVLRPGGKIIIMLALEGTYRKLNPTFKQRMKNALIALPGGWTLFELMKKDYHIFHPTYEALHALVTSAGFHVVQEVWQKEWHNILFLEAHRD